MRTFLAGDAAALTHLRAHELPDGVGLLTLDLGGSEAADRARIAALQMTVSARRDGPDSGLLLGFVLSDGFAGLGEAARAVLPEKLRDDAVLLASELAQRKPGPWCWQRLSGLAGHLLRDYASSHLALAEARAAQLRLERSLMQAEATLADARKEPLKLALRLEPTGVFAASAAAGNTAGDPAAESGRLVLTQQIPTPLANVVYIDVAFNRDGAASEGDGMLTVTTLYSHDRLYARRFKLAELRRGWNRFACSGRDLTLSEPLELTLELTRRSGPAVVPGLSQPSPVARECAVIDGAAPGRRPLALQVWCGIAGIRYPRHVGALAGADQDTAREVLSVPVDVLAAARTHSATRGDAGFLPVSFYPDTQSLLVHPLGRVPTVAQVPGLAVTGLRAVSATVTLRNPEARPTECMILAWPSGQRPPRLDAKAAGGEATPEAWVRLHAGEAADVYAELPAPFSGMVDVYLGARSVGTEYDLSWAFFHGVQLHCGGSGRPGANGAG